MGPKADEHLIDSHVIAENLIENIFNEALRAINERTDYYCFDSFESLKLHTFGSEDILEFSCPRKESLETPEELKSQETLAMSSLLSDICYPSLANLPEVCVHSSSISNNSKQGEGDFQHQKIREAVAFYRLEATNGYEDAIPCGSKDYYKNSPNSSLITETSHNELIANLQKEIDLSFENVQLSDSDDGLCERVRYSEQRRHLSSPSPGLKDCDNTNEGFVGHKEHLEYSKNVMLQSSKMQQSRKFCQLNDNEYFPHNVIPKHYDNQVVNENNIPYTYMPDMREDEQELISDGSEELVIIDSECEGEHLAGRDCLNSRNPFTNPFFPSIKPSMMILATPRTPSEVRKKSMPVQIINVESMKNTNNWEESIEIQVNITEPSKVKQEGVDNEGVQDEKVFQSRNYWSNVGLMSEHKVNPRFTGLVEDPFGGMESIPGISRVTDTYLGRGSQKTLHIFEGLGDKQNVLESKTAQYLGNERLRKDHHLSRAADGSEKGKNKKKFISRLSSSLTNLFRIKKKNPKL